jgi:hypothetical protein
MTWQTDAGKILAALVGLAICGVGAYLGWVVAHQSPLQPRLVWASLGTMFVGALVIPSIAPRLMTAAKQLASLLPSIKIGGQP